MSQNEHAPFLSQIKEIIRHTDMEYTFRMVYHGQVRPGQFFEVSIPKLVVDYFAGHPEETKGIKYRGARY